MQKFQKWSDTYKRLSKANKDLALAPEELETYALSAYLTGHDAESFQLFEQAHQVYLDQKKTEKAIRCAFWLGLILINKGNKARGSGWLARAERLLSDQQLSCAEEGLLLIPAALGAFSAGESDKALNLFSQAFSIGQDFDDNDLIILGQLGSGQALVQQGNVAKGIKLLDELMITLETEDAFPVLNGIVYCAVIETCRKVWDLGRAHEWTLALTRWCEEQPDIVPFRGQGLVRRAEIARFRGAWLQALEETNGACELLTRPPGESAAGEAYYLKAELFRLGGKFKQAEENYHEAAKWGRPSQPGLALLRLAQGMHEAAEISIRNTLKENNDLKRRAELLPHVVQIMLAVKQTEVARKATEELFDIANKFDAPYLYAIVGHSRGCVYLNEGKLQLALEQLQKALDIWKHLDTPYESALTQEQIGLVYQKMNDIDNSTVELSTAQWIFEQLNAIPDLVRINKTLSKNSLNKTHGLSLRELQVLRLVAAGKANKSVADTLFISERTVDRHVSNIFKKLNVSSRVEATTFAIKHQLTDNLS
ncbi:MAG: LuxR C-terminal-related transcriptional regulator [Fulvivirga sp.]